MPMHNSIADHARSLIEDHLVPYRHTALLVAIISLLGVRALVGGTGVGAAIYSILVMLVLMVAVYTIQVDNYSAIEIFSSSSEGSVASSDGRSRSSPSFCVWAYSLLPAAN
jgi:hypothetical protein